MVKIENFPVDKLDKIMLL